MICVILILAFILIHVKTKAVSGLDSLHVYQRIDISYCFGGQVYNDNFIYNPGISFQYVYGFMQNKYVGIGIGYGFQTFKNERFTPLYLEAIGYKKKNTNTSFIKMQIGYSIGWYEGNVNLIGYKYSGGFFIDTGVGRKISLNNGFSLFFHWSYRHQFAKIEYEVFGTQQYSEILNYDMLVISLSLLKEQE